MVLSATPYAAVGPDASSPERARLVQCSPVCQPTLHSCDVKSTMAQSGMVRFHQSYRGVPSSCHCRAVRRRHVLRQIIVCIADGEAEEPASSPVMLAPASKGRKTLAEAFAAYGASQQLEMGPLATLRAIMAAATPTTAAPAVGSKAGKHSSADGKKKPSGQVNMFPLCDCHGCVLEVIQIVFFKPHAREHTHTHTQPNAPWYISYYYTVVLLCHLGSWWHPGT